MTIMLREVLQIFRSGGGKRGKPQRKEIGAISRSETWLRGGEAEPPLGTDLKDQSPRLKNSRYPTQRD